MPLVNRISYIVNPGARLTGKLKQTILLEAMTTELKQRLEEVRQALLALHKTLVDSERVTYEQTVGAIRSPNQFLQLLTTDPWFAWLQPLSQLIVSMDEALDGKEPLTAETVDAAIKEANQMLVPSEIGEGFSHHYFDALQRDPNVVMAHGEVMKLFGQRKT
jgi:hypothetical protein